MRRREQEVAAALEAVAAAKWRAKKTAAVAAKRRAKEAT